MLGTVEALRLTALRYRPLAADTSNRPGGVPTEAITQYFVQLFDLWLIEIAERFACRLGRAAPLTGFLRDDLSL